MVIGLDSETDVLDSVPVLVQEDLVAAARPDSDRPDYFNLNVSQPAHGESDIQ